MRPIGVFFTFMMWAALPGAALARAPVVVELFTAQGCSACNTVGASIAKLAARPGLIVLTWSVDYWDYLGWTDTSAKPEFTRRQRAYEHRLGHRDVYTPQVIIAGRVEAAGDKPAEMDAAIRKARHARVRPPEMTFTSTGKLSIGPGRRPRGGAEVWLVRYDPRPVTVLVKAGDNRGASVSQRDDVRQLVRLGAWSGRRVTFKLPSPPEDGLATAALIQGARGGPVLSAAALLETMK
jgi:hypothetical protein